MNPSPFRLGWIVSCILLMSLLPLSTRAAQSYGSRASAAHGSRRDRQLSEAQERLRQILGQDPLQGGAGLTGDALASSYDKLIWPPRKASQLNDWATAFQASMSYLVRPRGQGGPGFPADRARDLAFSAAGSASPSRVRKRLKSFQAVHEDLLTALGPDADPADLEWARETAIQAAPLGPGKHPAKPNALLRLCLTHRKTAMGSPETGGLGLPPPKAATFLFQAFAGKAPEDAARWIERYQGTFRFATSKDARGVPWMSPQEAHEYASWALQQQDLDFSSHDHRLGMLLELARGAPEIGGAGLSGKEALKFARDRMRMRGTVENYVSKFRTAMRQAYPSPELQGMGDVVNAWATADRLAVQSLDTSFQDFQAFLERRWRVFSHGHRRLGMTPWRAAGLTNKYVSPSSTPAEIDAFLERYTLFYETARRPREQGGLGLKDDAFDHFEYRHFDQVSRLKEPSRFLRTYAEFFNAFIRNERYPDSSTTQIRELDFVDEQVRMDPETNLMRLRARNLASDWLGTSRSSDLPYEFANLIAGHPSPDEARAAASRLVELAMEHGMNGMQALKYVNPRLRKRSFLEFVQAFETGYEHMRRIDALEAEAWTFAERVAENPKKAGDLIQLHQRAMDLARGPKAQGGLGLSHQQALAFSLRATAAPDPEGFLKKYPKSLMRAEKQLTREGGLTPQAIQETAAEQAYADCGQKIRGAFNALWNRATTPPWRQ